MRTLKAQVPPPEFIRRWPRWFRIVFAWVALLVTCLPAGPLLGMAGSHLLGMDACDMSAQVADHSWLCTRSGRWLITLVFVALALPVAWIWIGLLQRIASYREQSSQPEESKAGFSPRGSVLSRSLDLGVAQRLISGQVTSRIGSHSIMVGGLRLLLWSAYPFHAGWLKQSDQAHIVYQTVPGAEDLMIALAFRVEGASAVRGVAARIQTASIPLMLACLLWFGRFTPRPSPLWASLCGVLLVMDVIYIGLMLRAKRQLKRLMERGEDE
jgi:hypothetical protein